MVDLARIKVLSLHQPWASLMVWSLKAFETRAWATSYRGPLLIHAAKANPREYDGLYTDSLLARALDVMVPAPDHARVTRAARHRELPRGCVLGVVELINMHKTEDVVLGVGKAERAFGDYSPGRFAWETAIGSARRFRTPVPARGHQRLFSPLLWGKETYDAVAAQLAEATRG